MPCSMQMPMVPGYERCAVGFENNWHPASGGPGAGTSGYPIRSAGACPVSDQGFVRAGAFGEGQSPLAVSAGSFFSWI